MELRQGQMLLTLKEIQSFLDSHAAQLGGLAETGARKKLDQSIAALTSLATAQSGNSFAEQSATQRQRGLTRALVVDHMEPIAVIAAADLPPTPEIAPLAMPKKSMTGERLVARARGMAVEAAKFEATFVQAGLPQDFVKQLLDAADALAGAVTERKQYRADRGAATKGMPQGLIAANKVVRVLDRFVKKTAREDAQLLAAWKIVKRNPRRRGQKATPATTAATEVAATPVTTPTSTGGEQ